jgi:hypothetical protein
VKKVVVLLVAVLVFAFAGCNTTEGQLSEHEEKALKFIELLRNSEFFSMSQMSEFSSNELIDRFAGILIIEYYIINSSEPIMQNYRRTWTVINTGDSAEMQRQRDLHNIEIRIWKEKYPDYTETINSTTEYFEVVLEAKNEYVETYTIQLDVSYSTHRGGEKRNNVTIVVSQKEPDSDVWVISDITGLNNF